MEIIRNSLLALILAGLVVIVVIYTSSVFRSKSRKRYDNDEVYLSYTMILAILGILTLTIAAFLLS